tara:strand:+ start:867 stop:1100 length:234 start_codon:yes stop_codon:yes gene_type:complete
MPFPFSFEERFVGKSLKDVIESTGLKQRFIAKKIGVSETMFSHQVAGRRKMTKEQKRTLAKTLKVRIRDIMKLTKSE